MGMNVAKTTLPAAAVVVADLLWTVTIPDAEAGEAAAACPPTLDFRVRRLAGEQRVHLCEAFPGRVLLVVNTAGECGCTPRYEGLEALYARYRDEGLVVPGFPCDDFGGQEPGDAEEIQDFCRLTYGVRFPMFEKTVPGGRWPIPFTACSVSRRASTRRGTSPSTCWTAGAGWWQASRAVCDPHRRSWYAPSRPSSASLPDGRPCMRRRFHSQANVRAARNLRPLPGQA